MVKKPKKKVVSGLSKKSEPIPSLSCVRMPTEGLNHGEYRVRIPLNYMIKAYEVPAAWFEFRFIGLKKGKI